MTNWTAKGRAVYAESADGKGWLFDCDCADSAAKAVRLHNNEVSPDLRQPQPKEPPSVHNREGTETEKWEAKRLAWSLGGTESGAGSWRIYCGGELIAGGLDEQDANQLVSRINESLSSLQQPKEQGLEEKESGFLLCPVCGAKMMPDMGECSNPACPNY